MTRFPVNFHRTFIPERHYIAALLRFAAAGKSGDYSAIHQETGIPFGKTEGKVPAIIDYARAMWLVALPEGERNAVKSPSLTPFGRSVLLEDTPLSETLTQWLCHLHMCRSDGGCDAWYTVFREGRHSLGMRFSDQQLENLLVERFGAANRSRTGPMIRMYAEKTAFASAGVMHQSGEKLTRSSAPSTKDFLPAHAAWLLSICEQHFPDQQQIPVTDLERLAGWQSITGWSDRVVQDVLAGVQALHAISVDRQMQPWILRPTGKSADWWPRIYETLI